MINLRDELNQHLLEIDSLIENETSRLKQYKGLEKGKLQVTSGHGIIQYLFVLASGDIHQISSG